MIMNLWLESRTGFKFVKWYYIGIKVVMGMVYNVWF